MVFEDEQLIVKEIFRMAQEEIKEAYEDLNKQFRDWAREESSRKGK
jgi:hypothetical protein